MDTVVKAGSRHTFPFSSHVGGDPRGREEAVAGRSCTKRECSGVRSLSYIQSGVNNLSTPARMVYELSDDSFNFQLVKAGLPTATPPSPFRTKARILLNV